MVYCPASAPVGTADLGIVGRSWGSLYDKRQNHTVSKQSDENGKGVTSECLQGVR